MRIKAIAIATLFALIVVSTGCDRTELCYDHTHSVEIDLRYVAREKLDSVPGSMAFYLIPRNGGAPLLYEMSGFGGGTFRVPYGDYDAVSVNSDTENLLCAGTDSFDTFTVFSRTTQLAGVLEEFRTEGVEIPRPKGTETEPVVHPVENFVGGALSGLSLPRGSGRTVVEMPVADESLPMDIRIRHVPNQQYLRRLCGVITSVSGSRVLSRLLPSNDKVTVSFPLRSDLAEQSASASVRIFGHCPVDTSRHVFAVYAVLGDGSQWYREYDVSAMMHSGSGKRITVDIDSLPLPKPIGASGGLNPDVEQWGKIDIDLPMKTK